MAEAQSQRREDQREREHQVSDWMRVHGTDLETVRLCDNRACGPRFLAERNFAARIALHLEFSLCSSICNAAATLIAHLDGKPD